MIADSFINELSNLAFENAFNPYTDLCELNDVYDAPKKRIALLKKMLYSASEVEVSSIWLGRDLGYRGGRRTGLALTDDVHLSHHAARWGVEAVRLTKGNMMAERTAAIIWSVLAQIHNPIFLWNVFPLHPYEAGKPFSNRAHNTIERNAGEELLAMLIDILKPKSIIAIGNDADKAAKRLKSNCKVMKVRHPSYGGQNIFTEQIQSIYNVKTMINTNLSLFDTEGLHKTFDHKTTL